MTRVDYERLEQTLLRLARILSLPMYLLVLLSIAAGDTSLLALVVGIGWACVLDYAIRERREVEA